MESDTDPDVPDVVTRPATMYKDPELPVTTLPVDTVTVPLTPVTVESPVTMDTAPLPPPADLQEAKDISARHVRLHCCTWRTTRCSRLERGTPVFASAGSVPTHDPVPMLRAHHAHACQGLHDVLPRG